VEGRDYLRIASPQQAGSRHAGIEVAEIFMYACHWCYTFEPQLSKWRATIPEDVEFVRIHAGFDALSTVHRRAFYAAQVLEKGGDGDRLFFEEIHERGNSLSDETALAELFARLGVDHQTFQRTLDSSAVESSVKAADDLVTAYRVTAVPSIVVNGKYLTNGSMARSYDNWFRIIDELVRRERDAETKSAAVASEPGSEARGP